MEMMMTNLQIRWRQWQTTPAYPAMWLILIQIIGGMRDMPMMPFFVIYLQEQIGMSPATISSVVAGSQLVGTVTALLGGALAVRLGSKWLLACGLACAGVCSLVFQAHWLWLVIPLWWIGGAGGALTTVGGGSYLTRLGDRKALGILSALYVLSITIGGSIGNPIGGVLIERYGFGAFGWMMMAITLVSIMVVIFLLPAQRSEGQPGASTGVRSFWLSVLPAVGNAQARLLIGMRCLPTVFYGMLSLLIPLLLNTLSGSKVTVAAYGTTMLIMASSAQLLAGRAADRWGARLPTLVAYAMLIVSGVGLAFSTGTVIGLFVFGILGNAAAWSLSTLMYVWVADGVPKAEHPATFGMLHAVWSLSMITGSMLGGWLVVATPGLPFVLAGLLNAGSLFLTLVYYRPKNTFKSESLQAR